MIAMMVEVEAKVMGEVAEEEATGMAGAHWPKLREDTESHADEAHVSTCAQA